MKVTLPLSDGVWSYLSIFWGLLIMLFLLRAFSAVMKRSMEIFLKSYLFFAVLYGVSMAMWASRSEPIGDLFKATGFLTFVWWIPIGVYSCSVVNKEVLYKVLLKASYLISFILFFNLIFHTSDTAGEGVEYDMFFGFAMITPTLFHLNQIFKKRNVGITILVIGEILSLILYANRAVLLSLAFFVFYKMFIARRSKNPLYPFLFIFLSLSVYVFRDAIIMSLVDLFSIFGKESRTITMALDNNLSDGSGREDFWAICIQMLKAKPVFGWGLGGEFVTLGRNLTAIFGGNAGAFATAHNGVLQLLVELGVFFGSIATFLFIKPIFRARKVHDPFIRDLIVIYFASYGITRLVSADGFYYAPQVAVYFYLFYFRNHLRLKTLN